MSDSERLLQKPANHSFINTSIQKEQMRHESFLILHDALSQEDKVPLSTLEQSTTRRRVHMDRAGEIKAHLEARGVQVFVERCNEYTSMHITEWFQVLRGLVSELWSSFSVECDNGRSRQKITIAQS